MPPSTRNPIIDSRDLRSSAGQLSRAITRSAPKCRLHASLRAENDSHAAFLGPITFDLESDLTRARPSLHRYGHGSGGNAVGNDNKFAGPQLLRSRQVE